MDVSSVLRKMRLRKSMDVTDECNWWIVTMTIHQLLRNNHMTMHWDFANQPWLSMTGHYNSEQVYNENDVSDVIHNYSNRDCWSQLFRPSLRRNPVQRNDCATKSCATKSMTLCTDMLWNNMSWKRYDVVALIAKTKIKQIMKNDWSLIGEKFEYLWSVLGTICVGPAPRLWLASFISM